MAIAQPPVKRMKIYPPDRGNVYPETLMIFDVCNTLSHDPVTNTVLIYAKQENEEVFHPLHLVPPSLVGLAVAVSLTSQCDFPGSSLLSVISFSDSKQVQTGGEEHSTHL
jgi:hypothetical protein